MNLTQRKPTKLDEAIDAALIELADISPTHQDYPEIMKKIQELYKLKEQNSPKRVTPDTLLLVGGNLAGILMILHYEHLHVIGSKALGFVLKTPR